MAMFTGKERDAETGLDYFGARYYSGEQRRFTSADPLSWIGWQRGSKDTAGYAVTTGRDRAHGRRRWVRRSAQMNELVRLQSELRAGEYRREQTGRVKHHQRSGRLVAR